MLSILAVVRPSPRLTPALLCLAFIAPAYAQQQQSRTVHRFDLRVTRYSTRAGTPARLSVSEDVLLLLLKSKRLTVTHEGMVEEGIVVAPNLTGDGVVVAASLMKAPGDYPVTITVEGENGEINETTLLVRVQPLESISTNSTLPPVVLLNGWQMPSLEKRSFCPVAANGSYDTFGSLGDNWLYPIGVPGVYFFDNCVECPNCSVEALGNHLGMFLNSVVDVSRFDLVGHSMGGLIARAYLSGLQSTGIPKPPGSIKVRKLIQVATPNFGAYLDPTFAATLLPGTQVAELTPGSALLWNLATWNQRSDDLRGVDALSIAGSGNIYGSGDGVVSTSSASIGFARDGSHTRILPYCHMDFPWWVAPFVDCQAYGIANVDEAPETGQIITSFLLDTQDWRSIGVPANQDPVLSNYGGVYFADQDAAASWISDFNWVSFGSVPLAAGAFAPVFYTDFLTGSDTFVGYSPSRGQHTCGTVTVPLGRYSVWRCKVSPIISNVTPTSSGARLVASNGTIALHGAGFGGTRCSNCGVWAYDPNASPIHYTGLQITSWTDQTISVFLPGSWSGFSGLHIQTASGHDTITFMALPK